jgi:pyridinium-3,5-bisthiocarboxylic acid mononucleotide nickel chelatase
MSKALLLDSVAGIAGDMFAASFVDAGLVSIDELNGLPRRLNLDGVRIERHAAMAASVTATRISVVADNDSWKAHFSGVSGHSDHHEHHGSDHHYGHNTNLTSRDSGHWHAHYRDIDRVIGESDLEDTTKELAQRIFLLLATAESEVHGLTLDDTAFHELGTIDSIMDVVMAAHCVIASGASQFFATPIKPGRGMINIAHGQHRVPPPASSRLLIGLQVATTPAAIEKENIELSTPTGIAILKALSPTFVSELPAGKLMAHGRGAGTRELGTFPNVFQVSLVETGSGDELPYERDEVFEIACNIDDDTAEHIAWLSEKLLEHGALDVWQTPAIGKKGRSLICLSCLVLQEDLSRVSDWILRNGTTFGVRFRKWERLKLTRHFEERHEDGTSIRYKMGFTATGQKLKEKREFEDWRKLADKL